jgi:hypothetical protein
VCVCVCVCARLFTPWINGVSLQDWMSPPLQNKSVCQHIRIISLYAEFRQFYKMSVHNSPLSVSKLLLAEIINEEAEEEGRFRRRLSFCSLFRPKRMKPRLSISFEFSSANLFLCQWPSFLIFFFLFLLHKLLSHLLSTVYHIIVPVRYQITARHDRCV